MPLPNNRFLSFLLLVGLAQCANARARTDTPHLEVLQFGNMVVYLPSNIALGAPMVWTCRSASSSKVLLNGQEYTLGKADPRRPINPDELPYSGTPVRYEGTFMTVLSDTKIEVSDVRELTSDRADLSLEKPPLIALPPVLINKQVSWAKFELEGPFTDDELRPDSGQGASPDAAMIAGSPLVGIFEVRKDHGQFFVELGSRGRLSLNAISVGYQIEVSNVFEDKFFDTILTITFRGADEVAKPVILQTDFADREEERGTFEIGAGCQSVYRFSSPHAGSSKDVAAQGDIDFQIPEPQADYVRDFEAREIARTLDRWSSHHMRISRPATMTITRDFIRSKELRSHISVREAKFSLTQALLEDYCATLRNLLDQPPPARAAVTLKPVQLRYAFESEAEIDQKLVELYSFLEHVRRYVAGQSNVPTGKAIFDSTPENAQIFAGKEVKGRTNSSFVLRADSYLVKIVMADKKVCEYQFTIHEGEEITFPCPKQ